MFSFTDFGRSTQRMVCLLAAAVIVAGGLILGVFGAQRAEHDGYSVTVTQLQ